MTNILFYVKIDTIIFKQRIQAMVNIFAKTLKDGKIKNTYKYTHDSDFEIGLFETYIKEICEHFDSPSPIVLAKHIRDYIMFNITTFTKEDFVEKIFFDKLIIELYKN